MVESRRGVAPGFIDVFLCFYILFIYLFYFSLFSKFILLKKDASFFVGFLSHFNLYYFRFSKISDSVYYVKYISLPCVLASVPARVELNMCVPYLLVNHIVKNLSL